MAEGERDFRRFVSNKMWRQFDMFVSQRLLWIQTPSTAGRPCWCCWLWCWSVWLHSSSTSLKGLFTRILGNLVVLFKKKKKITKKIIDFAGANTEVFFVCPATCRKIPWIHVQAEDSQEKDPEVISTVGQNDNMSKVKLSEFPSPKELVVKDLEPRSRVHAGKKHPSHRNILVLTTTKSTFIKVQISEYFRFPKFWSSPDFKTFLAWYLG